MAKTDPSKIDQLVAEARTHLKNLGIDTEGKRSDEILNMVRQERISALAERPVAASRLK